MVTAGRQRFHAAAGVLALHAGMQSHTLSCSERDGSEEKQEADREALRARIPWKPRLGRHEQRQERKGPLILRGATELGCIFQAPDCCFTARTITDTLTQPLLSLENILVV